MTLRYVDGTNGNDAWDGSVPVFLTGSVGPKKTISSAESIVAAGDIVHIRAGVYRESITLAASGSAGNQIEYRGDYAGAVWSGGVVRITGSDDDIGSARTNIVTGGGRSYRTFTNLSFSLSSGSIINTGGSTCHNWVFDKCHFYSNNSQSVIFHNSGANGQNWVIRNCIFNPHVSGAAIAFSINSSNNNHLVENCIFLTASKSVQLTQVGGVTVRNCLVYGGQNGMRIATALPAGQTMTVNNCIFFNTSASAVQGTVVGELIEDYNTFSACVVDRTNVSVGANSISNPPNFDPRWFFQAISGLSGNVVTPFDLSAWSSLINLAGTSPSTTDMRGTAAIGGVREWGPLEYDSTLKLAGGSGGISRSRTQ